MKCCPVSTEPIGFISFSAELFECSFLVLWRLPLTQTWFNFCQYFTENCRFSSFLVIFRFFPSSFEYLAPYPVFTVSGVSQSQLGPICVWLPSNWKTNCHIIYLVRNKNSMGHHLINIHLYNQLFNFNGTPTRPWSTSVDSISLLSSL